MGWGNESLFNGPGHTDGSHEAFLKNVDLVTYS